MYNFIHTHLSSKHRFPIILCTVLSIVRCHLHLGFLLYYVTVLSLVTCHLNRGSQLYYLQFYL